jgi:Fe-S-cluster containining protein
VPDENLPEVLRRDLQASLRHLHFMSMQTKHDLVDVISRLSALIEELIVDENLDMQRFNERRLRLREKEEERLQGLVHVSINNVPDKYQLESLPDIDCASLIHLCKARCCQLTFPLSFQDLDERVVAWNYSAPYQIRQKEDAYCVHNQDEGRQCGIYNHRPATCRQFDCRQDKRIWLDFEKQIPASEESIFEEPSVDTPSLEQAAE